MRIKIEDQTFECPELASAPVQRYRDHIREWVRIRVTAPASEVIEAFVDNITYSQEYEAGEETMTVDLSSYSIAGDVIDHRDGTVTVLMGKPTELETVTEALNILLGGAE